MTALPMQPPVGVAQLGVGNHPYFTKNKVLSRRLRVPDHISSLPFFSSPSFHGFIQGALRTGPNLPKMHANTTPSSGLERKEYRINRKPYRGFLKDGPNQKMPESELIQNRALGLLTSIYLAS